MNIKKIARYKKKDLKLYKLGKSKNRKTDSELTFLAMKRKVVIFCDCFFLPAQNKNTIR